jgi:hypothetical protein
LSGSKEKEMRKYRHIACHRRAPGPLESFFRSKHLAGSRQKVQEGQRAKESDLPLPRRAIPGLRLQED